MGHAYERKVCPTTLVSCPRVVGQRTRIVWDMRWARTRVLLHVSLSIYNDTNNIQTKWDMSHRKTPHATWTDSLDWIRVDLGASLLRDSLESSISTYFQNWSRFKRREAQAGVSVSDYGGDLNGSTQH